MALLVSGVIALIALETRTQLEWLPEEITWISVQTVLAVIAVIQLFSVWEQRHFLALRDRLVEQMETATEQRARADEFYDLSILDPLTGLYNRRFGERRLAEEIGRAAATGGSLLLLALDFDRFKDINDRHGHEAGDKVLKEFSRRLRRAIRSSDLPVRVGGDEFLAILPECPPDQVQTVLSRLTAFDLAVDGDTVHVSYSRGVARYQAGDTVKAMIKRADERLYTAKALRPPVDVKRRANERAPIGSSHPGNGRGLVGQSRRRRSRSHPRRPFGCTPSGPSYGNGERRGQVADHGVAPHEWPGWMSRG